MGTYDDHLYINFDLNTLSEGSENGSLTDETKWLCKRCWEWERGFTERQHVIMEFFDFIISKEKYDFFCDLYVHQWRYREYEFITQPLR